MNDASFIYLKKIKERESKQHVVHWFYFGHFKWLENQVPTIWLKKTPFQTFFPLEKSKKYLNSNKHI
jgi:hypothetical protein